MVNLYDVSFLFVSVVIHCFATKFLCLVIYVKRVTIHGLKFHFSEGGDVHCISHYSLSL